MDFSSIDGDKISLKSIDPDAALAGNQAFTFIGAAAFKTTAHSTYELRYEVAGSSGDILVKGVTNRDGVPDFSFLFHANALTSGDIIL